MTVKYQVNIENFKQRSEFKKYSNLTNVLDFIQNNFKNNEIKSLIKYLSFLCGKSLSEFDINIYSSNSKRYNSKSKSDCFMKSNKSKFGKGKTSQQASLYTNEKKHDEVGLMFTLIIKLVKKFVKSSMLLKDTNFSLKKLNQNQAIRFREVNNKSKDDMIKNFVKLGIILCMNNMDLNASLFKSKYKKNVENFLKLIETNKIESIIFRDFLVCDKYFRFCIHFYFKLKYYSKSLNYVIKSYQTLNIISSTNYQNDKTSKEKQKNFIEFLSEFSKILKKLQLVEIEKHKAKKDQLRVIERKNLLKFKEKKIRNMFLIKSEFNSRQIKQYDSKSSSKEEQSRRSCTKNFELSPNIKNNESILCDKKISQYKKEESKKDYIEPNEEVEDNLKTIINYKTVKDIEIDKLKMNPIKRDLLTPQVSYDNLKFSIPAFIKASNNNNQNIEMYIDYDNGNFNNNEAYTINTKPLPNYFENYKLNSFVKTPKPGIFDGSFLKNNILKIRIHKSDSQLTIKRHLCSPKRTSLHKIISLNEERIKVTHFNKKPLKIIVNNKETSKCKKNILSNFDDNNFITISKQKIKNQKTCESKEKISEDLLVNKNEDPKYLRKNRVPKKYISFNSGITFRKRKIAYSDSNIVCGIISDLKIKEKFDFMNVNLFEKNSGGKFLLENLKKDSEIEGTDQKEKKELSQKKIVKSVLYKKEISPQNIYTERVASELSNIYPKKIESEFLKSESNMSIGKHSEVHNISVEQLSESTTLIQKMKNFSGISIKNTSIKNKVVVQSKDSNKQMNNLSSSKNNSDNMMIESQKYYCKINSTISKTFVGDIQNHHNYIYSRPVQSLKINYNFFQSGQHGEDNKIQNAEK